MRPFHVLLAVLALPTLGDADVCPGGFFRIDTRVWPPPGDLREIAIDGGLVSITGVCSTPAPVSLTASLRGTRVRALLPACNLPYSPGLLRLRARIGRGCRRMRGSLRLGDRVQRFVALRHAVCGDGILDPNEHCDDHNTSAGDCCSPMCDVEPGCSGYCTSNADCAPDAYCEKAWDECDAGGSCVPRPVSCGPAYDLFCGCDAKTYVNRCALAAAGVSVWDHGPCSIPCGTIAGITCPPGYFCDLPRGECHSADLRGTCVPIPEACPTRVSRVCGCNGISYPNDCARIARRVQRDHDGACR